MYEPYDSAEDLRDKLKEEAPEDDLVIADMSGLPPRRPLLFPVFDAGKQMDAQKERFRTDSQQPPADLDREGRMAAVKGALGATLLIWLVYAVGFGIFIFVLTRLFRLL